MMKCVKCEDHLPANGDYVTCSVCDRSFHYNCSIREAKWRNLSAELRKKWVCVLCKTTHSRADSAASSQDDMDSGPPEDELTTRGLLIRMNTRLNTLDEVKKSVDTMSNSLAFLSSKYDDLLAELKVYKRSNDELRTDVDKLKSVCEEKDRALNELTRRFNALEQYSRGANLEIHGLAQEHQEELQDVVVEKVAAAIGLKYNPGEIQAAHRLPSRDSGRPPTLLLQFVSRAVKQGWLLAGRRRRLRSRDVVGVGESRVFFDDNLSPYYARLFHVSRKLAREKQYESVWTMNGTIRMKKARSDRKTIVIKDYDDLRLIV